MGPSRIITLQCDVSDLDALRVVKAVDYGLLQMMELSKYVFSFFLCTIH